MAHLELKDRIKKLEMELKLNLHLDSNLRLLGPPLTSFLIKEAQKAIYYAKYKLFEYGNKPGRLLGRKEENMIKSLLDKNVVRHFKTKHH